MRYRLRTLHLLLGILPPLIAATWWLVQWCYAYPMIPLALLYLAAVIYGPIACWRDLVETVCGPHPAKPSPRKPRRTIRLRYQRHQFGST